MTPTPLHHARGGEGRVLTFGSLFSGIGGIDLGFERAGMVCKWQVEIDPFCQRVLAKHWPNVARYSDVREVGKHNLEPVDVIAGGFPCQPHSLAGKRRGADDDRNLWPEYRRIIGEINPAWAVGENVPGIKTTMLDTVLSDLDDMDYQTRTLIIPACAFGAPHIRERVFILAHASSSRLERRSSSHGEHAAEGSNWGGEFTGGGAGKYTNVADANVSRLAQRESIAGNNGEEQQAIIGENWWAVEPNVGRVANGVPARVDRLRALGNAVVPQVAEWIARRILESHP